MRKTMKMKLSAVLGAAAFLFVGGAFVMANHTTAKAEDVTPTLKFKAGNVNFGDDVHTLFAVDAQNVGDAEVKVLLWNSAPATYTVEAAEIILDDQGTVDINETTCLKYTYEGLGAHEMTKNLYARAYAVVDGVACYSDPLKYSVLQYAYNKMGKTDATASTNQDYIDLLQAMLNYGGAVQTYTNQNTDRLANADYTYVKLTNAKFEDGFTKGLYLPSEEVKIIPEEGYKLSINAGSAFEDNGDGTVTLTVPENNVTSEDLFVEEGTVETLPEGELVTTTYTFANYTAGTQYAQNEVHVLDENVTVTTTDCHFTSELRIYSSATNNGVAIIESKNVIETFAFNAGNKVDVLNVYGSKDGIEWTLIEEVEITSTSYKDYTVAVGGGNRYQYLKLDVAGTQQVRIKSITLETYQKPLTDAEKVEKIAGAFVLDFTQIDGVATKTLATVSEEATIEWALADNANATLENNVLTTTNPDENTTITLTATFTVGEATATKDFAIALNHVITDAEKLAPIVNLFDLDFVEIVGAGTKTLPNSTEGATIAWALAEHDNAKLNGYELETTNPAEDTEITLTATLTLGEATEEKVFTIALRYLDETDDTAIVEAVLAKIEIEEEDREFTGDATLTLPITEDVRVTVEWSVDPEDAASIVDGVLTMTNPDADTTFTLTVTVTLNEATASKEFTITLNKEAVAEPTTLATFNLGANGSATHKDGSSAKTTYSETADGYTLNITGGDKMYPSSYDAKGNSCIKFGSSNAVGKCSFTVPENVTSVVLYVAKYKNNSTKINVNGTAYTLSNPSDNGVYDEIIVDTTTNKTITFTTVSGGARAMLNTIVFIGMAE